MLRISINCRLLLLFLFPVLAFAQTSQTDHQVWIRGAFVDESNKPIPFASVALYQVAGSVLVAGVISDETGKFALQTKPGNYYLKITALSYQDKTIPDIKASNQDIQIG